MTSPLQPRRRHLSEEHPTFRQPLRTKNLEEDNVSIENRALTKSSTFHSPTTPPAQGEDPIVNIPLLPRRSPTCPKTLEQHAVAAGERRIANLLGAVDRSLSGLENFSTDSQETLRPDDLSVPRFSLDAHLHGSDDMDVDTPRDQGHLPERKSRVAHKHHRSDSGIGSSVTESDDMKQDPGTQLILRVFAGMPVYWLLSLGSVLFRQTLAICHAPQEVSNDYAGQVRSPSEVGSGINGNAFNRSQHALSEYACRQIQKYIISPIVRESSLKDFHPLVQGIPYRVGRKEITCLRDLEKVLLWLAPVSQSYRNQERRLAYGVGVKKWSISKASFLNFCETSIQCIHTTVDYLNEADQRRPSDRPYTNGYFLDLTEQVRQYAAMITASRERLAAGRGSAEDQAMAYVPYSPLLLRFPTYKS